jgi:hypothetical protein
MGTGPALSPSSWRRFSLRAVLGWACVAWGASMLLSAMLSGGVPPREGLQRTRGQVETLQAGGGTLHFTLAGQGAPLRYLRRAGDVDGVQRLLEDARTRQVLLLVEPASGVVYEVEGESGSRTCSYVRDAWRDRSGSDVGLGLILMFFGARLVSVRPGPAGE